MIKQTILAVALLFGALSQAMAEKEENKFYDPIVKKLEDWTIKVDPKLLKNENNEFKDQVFTALANHLQRIKYILPAAKVKEMQKLPIRSEEHTSELQSQ